MYLFSDVHLLAAILPRAVVQQIISVSEIAYTCTYLHTNDQFSENHHIFISRKLIK